MTLHMYAGWTPKIAESSLDVLAKVAREKKVWKRFSETDVLIIDEISMVEANLLSRLSFMMQEALLTPEEPRLPFGGVQIVVTGDFYQLPPVLPMKTCLQCGEKLEGWDDRSESVYTCPEHGDFYDEDKWTFRSPAWNACNFTNVQLLNVHRQKDIYLMNLLHGMRKGTHWTDEQERVLLNHDHNVIFDNAIKLSPLRREVDTINERHMSKLATSNRTYSCIDHFHWQRHHPEFADATQPLASLHHHRYEGQLELKEGMHVILLANLDVNAGLVNGTGGKIIDFEEMKDETLPRAKKSAKDVATYGEQLVTHEHRYYVQERIKAFKDRAQVQLWPVVKFANGVTRTIFAHCSIQELGKDEPYSLLSRTQIPLIAGWASTLR